ncbi:MAG: hypothetical protein WBB27_14830 [Maribacter sp.]|jgi:hypothetical protein
MKLGICQERKYDQNHNFDNDLGHFIWNVRPLHLYVVTLKKFMMSNREYSQETEFLKDGPWDELYVITQHWKSDMEFYRDDLRFLHRLIDKYFIWITKAENLVLVKELKKELLELNGRSKDILEKVIKHRIHLGYLVEDPNERNAGIIKTEHEHLEDELSTFLKMFRKNRKEVFKITEYIIDSEKLARIIDS